MPFKPRTHNAHPRVRETKRERDNRSSCDQSLYGTRRWKEASRAFRRLNPLCRYCEQRGIVRPAEEVDHVIPHKGNLELFWDESNWAPACKRCNGRKAGRML